MSLLWFELSQLPEGTRVVFTDSWDIYPECIVPAGTQGIITANYLNEMQNRLAVLPDDEALRRALHHWDGEIILGTHLNSAADLDADPVTDDAAEWFTPSPLEQVA